MVNNGIKSLNDYKEELHRCSKCGLCQAECPLYQATGNECSVSRGQFIMLDGVVRGKLKLSDTINKYLDMCLKCGKCADFCPSKIDILDIMLCAKHEYFKRSIQGKIYSFFESKYVFNTLLKTIKFLTNIFSKETKSKTFDTKAVYFGGCISALRPDVDNYVVKLLNRINIEVKRVDFNCCGMAFLTTGNIDRFVENMKENIMKIPENVQFLITDCASCEWAWGKYVQYLREDDELNEKLSKIKIVSIYELIDKNDLKFKTNKELKLTYHNPCHEKHTENILNIIKNIKNSEYIELEGMNDCCGFAGFEHPGILNETAPVRKKKKDIIKKSKADYLLTSCVGCLVSLNLIDGTKNKNRLISFLKDHCEFD